MKLKFLLLFALFSYASFAQIEIFGTDSYEVTLTPSNCAETADCDGLVTEYLITDLNTIADDSLGWEIVTTSSSNIITPAELGIDQGNILVTPICYDLLAIQNLVNDMNTNPNCCGLINGLTPEGVEPLICDGVISQFPDGDAVTDLAGVLNVISAFGSPSLSIEQFIVVANTVNENAAVLALICTSSGAIAYCVNPEENVQLDVLLHTVENIAPDAMKISPNPVQESLQVSVDIWQEGSAQLSIFNTSGTAMFQDDIQLNAQAFINVNVADLPAGLYLLTLQHDSKRIVKKFVKK